MSLIRGIFLIFIFNFIIVSCSECSLSNSLCKYNNKVLTCYGNHSKTNEHLQPFEEVLPSSQKITTLYLTTVCLVAGDLDKFDLLKILKFSKGSAQLLDENIFTPGLGSSLMELSFDGNYSFSNSPFKHLVKLNNLTFIRNFKIESLLSKEFFSDSLSNLKNLAITHSGISSFNGDMFINLKSLEILDIYVNPIKEFPKAIQHIPSLKHLGVGHFDNLKVIKKPFGKILPNLELIWFMFIPSLTSIGNCAFCNFPNLKSIYLGDNRNLTWIHENAFGGLLPENTDNYGYKVENLEMFHIEHCNVSVLPEHLLNWSKIKHINLGGNKFICNCSNAWLIEDIQSKNPVFSDNLKVRYGKGHKSQLECYGPEHVKGKLLKDISTENCKEMICEKMSTSKLLWFFVGSITTALLMIFTTLIIFRNRVRTFYEGFQSNIEHIILQEYSDS